MGARRRRPPEGREGQGCFIYSGKAEVWGTLSLQWAWPLSSTTLEKPRVLAFSGPAALPSEDQWEACLSAIMSQNWTPDVVKAG